MIKEDTQARITLGPVNVDLKVNSNIFFTEVNGLIVWINIKT